MDHVWPSSQGHAAQKKIAVVCFRHFSTVLLNASFPLETCHPCRIQQHLAACGSLPSPAVLCAWGSRLKHSVASGRLKSTLVVIWEGQLAAEYMHVPFCHISSLLLEVL